jgi:DNA-binding transcriptional MerR regulator
MSRYSIKDLEQITGVSTHTIRIWERRYKLIVPNRTATNIRYYSDADLRKLLNVSLLKNEGLKISYLAGLEKVELEAQVLEFAKKTKKTDALVDQLVLAMVHFDENLFEKILSRAILREGMESCLVNIIFPFFERVGVLWQAGSINPAQEHFISNLLKQKLFVALDAMSGAEYESQPRMIFFLREEELHEIGLLFYAYLAKKNRVNILFLGQSVPLPALKEACEATGANTLFTSFTTPMQVSALQDYLNEISSQFPKANILVTGQFLKNKSVSIPNCFKLIATPRQFKAWIKENW